MAFGTPFGGIKNIRLVREEHLYCTNEGRGLTSYQKSTFFMRIPDLLYFYNLRFILKVRRFFIKEDDWTLTFTKKA